MKLPTLLSESFLPSTRGRTDCLSTGTSGRASDMPEGTEYIAMARHLNLTSLFIDPVRGYWELKWHDGSPGSGRRGSGTRTADVELTEFFSSVPVLVNWSARGKLLLGLLTAASDEPASGRRGWITVFLGQQGYGQVIVRLSFFSPRSELLLANCGGERADRGRRSAPDSQGGPEGSGSEGSCRCGSSGT